MIEKEFNILFIDDSKIVREQLVSMLEGYDYKIHHGSSAKEALRLLGNHPIDLIFMDYHMPEVDGFQAIKIIRNNKRMKNIPIVILTAKDPKKLMEERSLELGAIDYLIKPINQLQLHKTIELYKRFIFRELEMNNELKEINSKLKTEIDKRKEIELDLKSSQDEKNKFYSIVAHDLKSPFNGLLGLLDLISDESGDYSKEELIKIVKKANLNALKLYKLVENLLTWSKSEMGEIQFGTDYFLINDVIRSSIEVYKLQVETKELELDMNIDEPVLVYFDKMAADTIMRNLISNAIKFTGSGGKISIGIESDDEYTRVIIKDTGVGISEENIKKLFKINSMFSLDGTDDETGSGLGLIISKDLACELGGDIEIESLENMGTIVKFKLPNQEVL